MTNDDDTVAILPLSYSHGNGQQSDVVTLIHDAFQPLSYWNNFMPRENFVGVAIDTHIYQMFLDEVGLNLSLVTPNQQHFRGHPTSHRPCRSTMQGISGLHAETRDHCLISIRISCGRLSASGHQQ